MIAGAKCIKQTDAHCFLQIGQNYRYENSTFYAYFCLSESMEDDIDLALDAMVMMLLLACVVGPAKAQRRRRRQENIIREKECFWKISAVYCDEDFQKCFRMSRSAFRKLVAHLRPWISRYGPHEAEMERAAHLSGRTTQTEVCVAIFLRMMAGGAVHDICALYRVGPSTCYKWFGTLLDVVCERLPLNGIPTEEKELRAMAVNFAESRPHSNPLPGCVAALDGIQIAIDKPREDMNPLHFFSRKGFFALTLQAIVDSDYRFLSCSSLAVGGTHDSLAFRLSSLSSFINAGNLPRGFWIAADEAYRCTNYIIIPFSRPSASLYQDGYNFFQSSHRLHVEQAFGILKNRWGILWRPLKHDMENAVKITPAAMKLHNFCIDNDGGIPKAEKTKRDWWDACEQLDKWLKWVRSGEDPDDWMDIELEPLSTSAKRAEKKSEIRGKLVLWLRRKARLRPETKVERSRRLPFTDIRLL